MLKQMEILMHQTPDEPFSSIPELAHLGQPLFPDFPVTRWLELNIDGIREMHRSMGLYRGPLFGDSTPGFGSSI
jgi:hypothetical protein